VIVADPRRRYYGDPDKDQAGAKRRELMSTADIAALPVSSITAPSATLFLWATGPRVPAAIKLMEAWGFQYLGVAYVWVKTAKDGRIMSSQGGRPTFTNPPRSCSSSGRPAARVAR
jgi:N6-adenosine-specific RNA methylase IME4